MTDGSVSVTQSLFHKQVKTLHLDFIPRATINTDSGESIALSVPTLVRIYQLLDNKAIIAADYMDLLNNGDRVLGSDCLASQEEVVKPGGHNGLLLIIA
ncbi:type VI secretion lipoprotein TssJ [Photorhabdus australis]|uniref:type VI secretion lipoprotein TssJ n=1 Tax=Photorhabdus australis TaxID=286156 RepID=UPI0009079479|nr:type VI secretion lipoprotein TssJ [Photorhabdus australis]